MSIYSASDVVSAIAHAAKVLDSRKDEINRLNVFPVPDGDTGTNMSLTLATVVETLGALSAGASSSEYRRAITTGALMGARGNSGVITSQILRGLCEGFEGHDHFDTVSCDAAFARSVEVAFKAVRKPVEGTILTVLRDTAQAAKRARRKKMETDEALHFIVSEAYASVERTPEFLPVLRENNVVDAGGFGLAIFFDAFVSALTGSEDSQVAFSAPAYQPKVAIEQINDWEGSAYLYCTEFLVYSDVLDNEEALDFLQTMGDCELCVGSIPNFKVHVHTNTPDKVLAWMLERGQISEVHIHNMKLQSEERTSHLEQESATPAKALGLVSVATGAGNVSILESFGVDCVVSGGQTMNPSTKELLDAIQSVHAEKVIVLPNNKNIIMASQSAADLAEKPCAVVATTSLPEAFAALFAFDEEQSLEDNLEEMTQAFQEVKTGEITVAVKESKDAHGNPIAQGDVIGIAQGSIEVVAPEVAQATLDLLQVMDAENFDTLTLLAGEDMTDDGLQALTEAIEQRFGDLEVNAHRGDQPLYPVILSLE